MLLFWVFNEDGGSCFSETLVSTCESIRHQNAEEQRYLHSLENLNSHNYEYTDGANFEVISDTPHFV
jgi:hypothetical protein